MHSQTYDVIIIGSGPAGLTAAIYTSRAHLNTLVLAGRPAGGQLMDTTDVENFPGFPKGIMGPQLMADMKEQALRFGTEYLEERVVALSGSAKENFTVLSDTDNKSYNARSIIVATGAQAKWLNIEKEQEFIGKGVSACATCDGFFFKDKVVAVVGGGDSAMEESTFLTKFASKVYVLVRKGKDELKASKIMQKRAFYNDKIEFIFNTEVDALLGQTQLEGIRVKNTQTNELTEMEDVKGLFMAIGHKPSTEFLGDFIEKDEVGYALVTNNTHSSVKGVFVAGDVADHRYRQAITAAGMGCMAALDVEHFLEENS